MSVVRVEVDFCNLTEISKTVVHITLVFAPIPPAKLVYHKGTILEDTEVTGFAWVWSLGTERGVAEGKSSIHCYAAPVRCQRIGLSDDQLQGRGEPEDAGRWISGPITVKSHLISSKNLVINGGTVYDDS